MATAELSIPISGSHEFVYPSTLARLFWSNDMAMDLGTANTLIYVKNQGIILNEPSIVAISEETGKPLAVGHAAKRLFGKTSDTIRCVRPMKDGVIADFNMTALMIDYMISKVSNRWSLRRPRMVIGVPSGITQVEKRAVIDAAACAGAKEVRLVEEPMAAALGAHLPVDKAVGNLIVDIGGGTTEVAIISLNGTVYSHSIRVAGDEMDEAIQRHLKRHFGLQIGVFEAERIKMIIGSALPFGQTRKVMAFGRAVGTNLPSQIEVTDEIIREAMHEPISAIVSSVATALEQASPEIIQDVYARGVFIAGGGALLKGLCERLNRETGIKFQRVQDPLSCVVRGVGRIVDNLRDMKELCVA